MSGWPDDWEQRKRGQDCPMCASIGGGDNEHGFFVAELTFTEVQLERRSRLAGYCVVIWKDGHVTEASDLNDDAAAGYWRDVMSVARVLEAEFKPMKMNLLTLGNWVPHLHTHVLPRYVDDPAPGGPITWADVFAEQPNDEVVLKAQVDQIRVGLGLSQRR
ncbi:MAG TPA: HIT family protein [Acidimicrobiales bacterium]